MLGWTGEELMLRMLGVLVVMMCLLVVLDGVQGMNGHKRKK